MTAFATKGTFSPSSFHSSSSLGAAGDSLAMVDVPRSWDAPGPRGVTRISTLRQIPPDLVTSARRPEASGPVLRSLQGLPRQVGEHLLGAVRADAMGEI